MDWGSKADPKLALLKGVRLLVVVGVRLDQCLDRPPPDFFVFPVKIREKGGAKIYSLTGTLVTFEGLRRNSSNYYAAPLIILT